MLVEFLWHAEAGSEDLGVNEDTSSLEEPAERALEGSGDWGAEGGGCQSWSQRFLKRKESLCGKISSIVFCSLGLHSANESAGSPATLLGARPTLV